MKGILRSALLFCTASSLQRRLMAGNLLLAIVAPWLLALMRPSRDALITRSTLLDLLLTMCIWASLCVGSVTFRGISAPRTLRFAPYARLQLGLGVLLSAGLLAGLVTLKAALLGHAFPILSAASGSSLPGTFLAALAMTSLAVVWLFFLVGDSAQGRWLAVLALFLGGAVLALHLAFGKAFPGVGSAWLASVTVATWSLFAAWYLRAQRIDPPALMDSWRAPRMSRRQHLETRHAALNIYLLRRASVLHACWPDTALIVAFNAAFLISMLAANRHGRSLIDLSYVLTGTFLIAGSAGLRLASPIAQRARTVWIRGGCSRQELFDTAERLSLRCLACVGVPTLILSVTEWGLLPHGSADWKYLLCVGLATLLCDVYFGLTGVGGRSPGAFALIASTLLGLVLLLPGSLWLSWGITSWQMLIPIAEGALALALRYLAQRRWQRLDWLICKPAPLASQALRSAA